MALAPVTLDDKYTAQRGRIFVTGTQALVRLPMLQHQRYEAAGHNTAGFISGYRGSPLAAIDQQLWLARTYLDTHHIHFQPGVNEDLAATALSGSQQLGLFQGAKFDGVFGMFYAKGPGIDRSGDALRHANLAGTSQFGGVLALAGDDHMSKSSTTAHQSEYALMDAMIPILHPAGVQEFIDLGLQGWALSRYAGCWVGFKLVADTMESSASVRIDPENVTIRTPDDFEMPDGGLNLRWPDPWLDQEERLHRYKLDAAPAHARANGIDRVIFDGPKRRFGIISCGKSYLDLRQALDDLGIDEEYAAEMGLSVYKPALVWPMEPVQLAKFAEGLDEILVVEEKRGLMEGQLKELLYNQVADKRPVVVGKKDEKGAWLLPSNGELTPGMIARVIAKRLAPFHQSDRIDERVAFLDRLSKVFEGEGAKVLRTPYFCSGCPHNSSTVVPEGSRALAGIGCHYMAQWMDRSTATYTQMGAEGSNWIGQAPFTEENHVFVNIGDGTYYHSGLLAIRAAIASGANMTYKILYNDAVAMTGGQQMDGPLTVAAITRQVHAEGAAKVVVVTDEPDKYPDEYGFADGVTVHDRKYLDQVQRELREIPGVTVLVYDQTCAAEKRRRRKRGTYPDPAKRVFINELVCEGCGDCSRTSNCLSVVPVETTFGRKRRIDQSSCNKDYSCVEGFCPSFVTVLGGEPKKPKPLGAGASFGDLPEPEIPLLDEPYGILITGVGGTGVVTIGAILTMAAHIEGKGCSVLDMTGLAQKGGAVVSHVKIAADSEQLYSVRLASGGADVILGGDVIVTARGDNLEKIAKGKTSAVINTHEIITGDFTRNPDYEFPGAGLGATLNRAVGAKRTHFVDATGLATALIGDSIAANLFMMGYAWQLGLMPVSREAIEQALELNNVAVEANKQAFLWGRRAAHDGRAVEELVAGSPEEETEESLESLIEDRVRFLTRYQSRFYAARYRDLVARVRRIEQDRVPGEDELSQAVARNAFKLMAYKDEYEVARLYARKSFHRELTRTFDGDFEIEFHLAPPIFAKRDPETGHLQKRRYGAWVMTAFRMLAKLKALRGTIFDPFGHTEERRMERALIEDYRQGLERLGQSLHRGNYQLAVEIASIPESIRGYGHVKLDSIVRARSCGEALLEQFENPTPQRNAAE
ncbi:MAG TPA: indolepyruvate ferredoxin oxidoreductase family protein [Rhodospirillaceae bacterium]|nr:indolepyruvate ferredoxin oxidoreductase family protein [Rhodospirillaceae bacterium]